MQPARSRRRRIRRRPQFGDQSQDLGELVTERTKDERVRALLESTSFSSTHTAVQELGPYLDLLSEDDAKALYTAGMLNNQIAWILEDGDVRDLYTQILKRYPSVSVAERASARSFPTGWLLANVPKH